MKTLLSEKTSRILRNKKDIEKELEVKILVKKGEVLLEGSPENEFLAEKVIDAIGFGFPLSAAFLIKKEDHMFEILSIKDHTKRKDLVTIRARLIGKKGKTLKTLATLTDCFFELKNNTVGIIGRPESIKNAQDAVIYLIQGSKQANVYKFLEKHRNQPIIDLGLKPQKKKGDNQTFKYQPSSSKDMSR
jgi:KH domain-containing protein